MLPFFVRLAQIFLRFILTKGCLAKMKQPLVRTKQCLVEMRLCMRRFFVQKTIIYQRIITALRRIHKF
ncbi:MAG: hypothetical protein LBL74_07300 [Bacteroidales bacterium]|nr:hypothetical protein [Bacteroidales bacterium]